MSRVQGSMTEIRCVKCNRLLGKMWGKTRPEDLELEIKCPKCKYMTIIKRKDFETSNLSVYHFGRPLADVAFDDGKQGLRLLNGE